MSSSYTELHFEILKMAKEMLEAEYHAKRQRIIDEWYNVLPGSPAGSSAYPVFPSANDVIAKAQVFTEFVRTD